MGFVMGQSGHALGSVIAPKVKKLEKAIAEEQAGKK
jgi:hypothetical protein